MKTLFFIILVASTSFFNIEAEGQLEDGVYFAQELDFVKSGWKDNVTLVVGGGKITEAHWNGSSIHGGTDKITRSINGRYPIVEKGGAKAPWHEQARIVENYLLKTQSMTKINLLDERGHTDTISGASITIGPFMTLVNQAIEQGPVGYGPYKDGVYHAEEMDNIQNEYKHFLDITVTSGYIVSVAWDASHINGGKNKEQKSQDGQYPLVESGGGMAPWHKQAYEIEAYVIKNQDITQPDVISGATISIDPFFTLLNTALSGATR